MWIDDVILSRSNYPLVCSIWTPSREIVVLGNGNNLETETYKQQCEKLGVTILRRYGGGGTVVLYPGCLVVSIGAWVKSSFGNSRFFQILNNLCNLSVETSYKLGVSLGQNGISDLTIGARKWGGTSLFRSREYLLYQASLLLTVDLPLIDSCLPHPTIEPEYRKKKSHGEFLTGILDQEALFVEGLPLKADFVQKFRIAATGKLQEEFLTLECGFPVEKYQAQLAARALKGQLADAQIGEKPDSSILESIQCFGDPL